jgi:GTPase
VANKVDLPSAREALESFTKRMKKRGITVLSMSGATGEGIQGVLDAVAKILFSKAPKTAAAPQAKVSVLKVAQAVTMSKRKPTSRAQVLKKRASTPKRKSAR